VVSNPEHKDITFRLIKSSNETGISLSKDGILSLTVVPTGNDLSETVEHVLIAVTNEDGVDILKGDFLIPVRASSCNDPAVTQWCEHWEEAEEATIKAAEAKAKIANANPADNPVNSSQSESANPSLIRLSKLEFDYFNRKSNCLHSYTTNSENNDGRGCTASNVDQQIQNLKPATELTADPTQSNSSKQIPPLPSDADPVATQAILHSKVLGYGTVIRVEGVENCPNYDWTTLVLAEEASSTILFGPQDATVFCDAPRFNELHKVIAFDLLVVVPVRVISAQIVGSLGDLADPLRKGASLVPMTKPDECAPGANVPSPHGLVPCDVNANWLRHGFYKSYWIYNRLTQPGVFQGSISFTPIINRGSKEGLTYDLQVTPWTSLGNGWIGLPTTFEKSSVQSSSLDSFTTFLSYSHKVCREPMYKYCKTKNQIEPSTYRFDPIFRPADFTFKVGPELAPTRPRDLNVVTGFSIRQPVIIDAFRQPSWISVFAVEGVEVGRHVETHLADEPANIARAFTEVDTSMRWPFRVAPNFISTKPITFDYSYRTTWLGYAEPYGSLPNSGPIDEFLTNRRRSITKMTLNEPWSPYLNFKVTVLRGSLPPDYRSVGWTVLFGLTLASTGTAEH